MRYERDENAVREARESKKKAEDDIAIAKLQEQIDLIQKSIDLLNEQKEAIQEELDAKIKALDEELEAQNKYYEELIESTEKSYDQMIKETEAYWDSIIEGMEAIKSKWEELAEIETIAKAFSDFGPIFDELGIQIEDVLSGDEASFEKFKTAYIQALTDANSENQHFLDGLKYATDGAATAFSEISGNADKTQEALGKVAEATEPLGTAAENVTALGNAAGGAVGGVGQLADKTGDLAEDAAKVQELANAIDTVKNSITELSGIVGQNPFESLTTPLTTLLDLLTLISTALTGESAEGFTSVLQGLQQVSEVSLETIIEEFNSLNEAVNGVITSITGGGSGGEGEGESGTAKAGKEGSQGGGGKEGAEGSGDTLIGALEQIQTTAESAIGSSAEAEEGTTIGDFVTLGTVIDGITNEKIGTEDNESTLVGVIPKIQETADEAIRGDGGAISAFEELAEAIQECVDIANELVETIAGIGEAGIMLGISALPAGFAGTAHAQGTALLSGDWGTTKTEKALVGELGPELLVTPNGRYQTVGDNGPEIRTIPKDSIIFNHKQTAEILNKKNQIGKSYANGTFTPLEDDLYAGLAAKFSANELPTMSGIISAFDTQTKAIKNTIQNVARTNTSSNVNMNNTFNISGVTGEDVARQINSTLQTTFMGLSINTMQYAKAR